MGLRLWFFEFELIFTHIVFLLDYDIFHVLFFLFDDNIYLFYLEYKRCFILQVAASSGLFFKFSVNFYYKTRIHFLLIHVLAILPSVVRSILVNHSCISLNMFNYSLYLFFQWQPQYINNLDLLTYMLCQILFRDSHICETLIYIVYS